ncbi:MAG: hypothetical protein ABT05_03760 [Lautropia sp. SCN 66-9]|nr:MAG: hypothetical protein ABT05_03760 [Lautropia sp. SCN 66-9]
MIARREESPSYAGDPDFAEVACPSCGTRSCEVVSLFGSAASEVLFQCRSCRTCFNWVKWQGKLPFDTASPSD